MTDKEFETLSITIREWINSHRKSCFIEAKKGVVVLPLDEIERYIDEVENRRLQENK